MNSFTEENEQCGACEYEENLATLRQIPFFALMPMETQKILAYLFVREIFKPGDYLFQYHESADRACYLVAGQATLLRPRDETEKPVGRIEKGTFIGGLTLLGKMRHLYSMKAETDLVCLMLTREKFVLAMEQFPDLKPKVIQALVDRVWEWENRFLMQHGDQCDACYNYLGLTLV